MRLFAGFVLSIVVVIAAASAGAAEPTAFEGTYRGNVHMIGTNNNYEGALRLTRRFTSTRSQDGATTLPAVTLIGNLNFPIFDGLTPGELEKAETKYRDVATAMGLYTSVIFDYGNYKPETRTLIMTYSVPGYAEGGSFGNLTGKITDGHFIGQWFVKPLGMVADFDLVIQAEDSSDYRSSK